jgi:hypothetical protein
MTSNNRNIIHVIQDPLAACLMLISRFVPIFFILNMDATYFSNASAEFRLTPQLSVLEDRNLHNLISENFKP